MTSEQLAIARARDRFAESGVVSGEVAPGTARSWRRCAMAGLRPDHPLTPVFGGEVDESGRLVQAADPVATRLTKELADADVAMVLADREGRILKRWAGKRLLADLDDISALPGFIFDESTVGTSALGTAMEDEDPVLVRGAEHFISRFYGLCAAGTPIRHPVSGRVEGAVDLVCATGPSVTFMLPLITRAAREIEERLLLGNAEADRNLLDRLLLIDRRGPQRARFAVNGRLLLANSLAGDLVPGGGSTHTALWEQVQRAMIDRTMTIEIEPATGGSPVCGIVRKVVAPDGSLGAIVQLRAERGHPQSRSAAPSAATVTTQRLRAGLPGRSAAWRSVLNRAAQVGGGGRLLLVGHPGVGKAALARALVHLVPDAEVVEWDARSQDPSELRERVSRPADSTRRRRCAAILRHLDELDAPRSAHVLASIDALSSDQEMLIIATLGTSAASAPEEFASRFDHVVELPRLDDRREDIPDIVAALLRQHVDGLSPVCTAEAMQDLMRRDWPGNIVQLNRVLQSALSRASGRTIGKADLPTALTPRKPRRGLTRLERAEREAIYNALVSAGGSRSAAALELGISRSTLYRKIAALGLDT
jgi:transcriptional regulator of acetoin/glycerol metabolism